MINENQINAEAMQWLAGIELHIRQYLEDRRIDHKKIPREELIETYVRFLGDISEKAAKKVYEKYLRTHAL